MPTLSTAPARRESSRRKSARRKSARHKPARRKPSRRKSRARPGVAAPAVAPSAGGWEVEAVAAGARRDKRGAPRRPVPPGLIAQGATLLLRRRKPGKRVLAIAVAGGRTTLGTLQPDAGDVLSRAPGGGERHWRRAGPAPSAKSSAIAPIIR